MKIKTRGVRSLEPSDPRVADPSDREVVEPVDPSDREATGPVEVVGPAEVVDSPDSCVAVSAETAESSSRAAVEPPGGRASAKRRSARRAGGSLMGFLYGDLC